VSVAFIGVGAGLAGAFVLKRFMRNLLFGVDAADPATFTTVALLLTAIALAASYLPARRAARIDPMVSLRSE
jgi:putative ABC transport system permease protein